MADFFEGAATDPGRWDKISAAAVERMFSRYTWPIYASRMITLSQVYRRVVHMQPVHVAPCPPPTWLASQLAGSPHPPRRASPPAHTTSACPPAASGSLCLAWSAGR